MKALIRDGVAVNVVTNDMLDESFHPDVAALFEDVPNHVRAGYRLDEDGKWVKPSDSDDPANPPQP